MKAFIKQVIVPHAIQHVKFVVNNLFQQQHSEVFKPAKRLKLT